MPTITANTTDGYQASGLQTSWDAVHDVTATPQGLNTSTAGSAYIGIRAEYAAARSRYYLARTFFDWDVQSLSGTITSATITSAALIAKLNSMLFQ